LTCERLFDKIVWWQVGVGGTVCAWPFRALGREDLHPLTSAALADDLVAIRKAIEGLEAQFSRRLHHFDRSRGFAATHSDSTQAWLRYELHMTGAGAADRVRVSRRLDELPSTFAVLNAGAISYTHAAMIARTADRVGMQAFGNAEAILLPVALQSDPSDLARCTRSSAPLHRRRWRASRGQGEFRAPLVRSAPGP